MGDAGGEEGQVGKPVEPAQEFSMPPCGVVKTELGVHPRWIGEGSEATATNAGFSLL